MNLNLIVNLLMIITIAFITVLVYRVVNSIMTFKRVKKAEDIVWKRKLKETEKGYFSYERIEKYLRQNGSPFKLTPYAFIQWKVILSILTLFAITKEFNIFFGLIGSIIGFFLLDILIKISNTSDNDKIITDLAHIYDSLRIQTKAGVFITHALGECYLIAENKRLKKALSELNADLILNKNLERGIEEFNSKFDNNLIDSFCMTILQSAKSGKTADTLSDLSEQIKEIDKSISGQKKNKTSRKNSLIEILIFIDIVAILIFAIFNELTRNLIMF